MPFRFFLALFVFFSLSCPAFAAEVTDISASLDCAQSQADVSRQAAALEKMTSGKGCADVAALTQLGRAYYLLGDSESDKKKSLPLLQKAASMEDRVLAADPGNAHALYWRSLSLLLQADIVGGLKALKMVKEALRGLELVSDRDGLYDSAGPYRVRGKVLIDAPSWSFIGDKKKGLSLLEKARDMAPACLLNHLYLAQAYAANGRKEDAKAQLGFVLATPANPRKQKDDMDTKAEARKLLDSL